MRDLVDELLHAKVKAQLFGGDHAPRLGRLIILERIGAGAMGDVFAAHDPRLDRRVAVKLVRPTTAVPAERVLAEARALAKLAHPNVVAIYDAEYVDAFDAPRTAPSRHAPDNDAREAAPDDDAREVASGNDARERRDGERAIAIVMELAPGISLRAWLATPRTWLDITRVLRDAAAGLAAAHAAGLVHRDIKPDNILVGEDRTRVVDFGLAFASSSSRSDDEAVSGAGTPSYMAPEVLGGGPATPESDQFSFGVTMFEALYGVRPHAGSSREELRIGALSAATARPKRGARGREASAADAVAETAPPSRQGTGALRSASDSTPSSGPNPRPAQSASHSLPSWLHAIAVRALAPDPRDRFASMVELSAALGRERRRKRRIAVAIGAVLVAAATSAIVAYRARGASDPCGGADARVGNVWSRARALEVRALIGDVPWAPTAIAALDAHRTAWATSYRNVCTATQVRGEQSDTLLDLRMRCLDRALERFSALVDVIAAPLDARAHTAHADKTDTSVRTSNSVDGRADNTLDASSRAEITSAIAELPSPRECEALVDVGELALPADPAGRQRAIAARHDIARVQAAFSLSRYREARAIGESIERSIAGLDAPSVIAELAAVRAAIEARIGTAETAKPALDRALVAASRAGAPELETRVWAMRLRHELFAGDPARVEELMPLAKAAAARAKRDGGELEGIAGEALRDRGNVDEARRHLERAWASKDPLRADQRAVIAMNLGAVHLLAGDLAKAEGAFVRAHELAESVLGAGHPSLALYLDKRAAVDRAHGRVREALANNTASVEMRVTAYGKSDRSVATSLLGRSRTYLEMGDLAAAQSDASRALAIREEVFGANSPRLGEVEAILGDIALAHGDDTAAAERYRRAHERDPRVQLTLRFFAAGGSDPDAPRTIIENPASQTELVGVLVLLLGILEERTVFDPSRVPVLATFVDRWRRMPRPADPTLSYVLALTTIRNGDRATALEILRSAFADLPDQPTRTRLRFARRLADLDPSDTTRDTASTLRAAMPQLADDALDRPGPD